MNKLIFYLFLFLSFLIFLDYLTTYYGIAYLGATELNPLYNMCGNLKNFFAIKTLFTFVGLSGLFFMISDFDRIVINTLIFLNILYGVVIVSNIWQMWGIITV